MKRLLRALAAVAALAPAQAGARPHAPNTHAPTHVAVGRFVEWGLDSPGDRAIYRAGDLTIRLTAALPPVKGEDPADGPPRTPILTVSAPGRRPFVVKGVEGDSNATTWFAVGKIDPQAPGLQILFASFSAGMHCCTNYTVIGKTRKGNGWTAANVGDYDGAPWRPFPHDLDGDGAPDLAFEDDAFDYAFCSYACSKEYALPRTFEVVGGRVWETTRDRRHGAMFERALKGAEHDCLVDHSNGACAAYVAAGARLGRRTWAWSRMLGAYTHDGTQAGSCSVYVSYGDCPKGKVITYPDFPHALEAFLVSSGYMKASDARFTQSVPTEPSFFCRRARSPVEHTICRTRALRVADIDLAYLYSGVLANSRDKVAVARDEAAWLHRRDSAGNDAKRLLALYAGRIRTLESARS